MEHLDDFLSGDQLLNIAIQFSEAVLLLRIITLAALSAELDIPEHDTVAHRYNQREPPVQDIQQGQCSHNLDEALDNHRKTVVQGICHRVDIVREKTHDIAVASAVENCSGSVWTCSNRSRRISKTTCCAAFTMVCV